MDTVGVYGLDRQELVLGVIVGLVVYIDIGC